MTIAARWRIIIGSGKVREERISALTEALPVLNTGICFDRPRQRELIQSILKQLNGKCICAAHLKHERFEVPTARVGGKTTLFSGQLLRLCAYISSRTNGGRLLREEGERRYLPIDTASEHASDEPSAAQERINRLLARYAETTGQLGAAVTKASGSLAEKELLDLAVEQSRTQLAEFEAYLAEIEREAAKKREQLAKMTGDQEEAASQHRLAVLDRNRLSGVQASLVGELHALFRHLPGMTADELELAIRSQARILKFPAQELIELMRPRLAAKKP